MKNMMEYEGIDAARLEAMEERMKKDVVAEVRWTWDKALVLNEGI